jgi:hypothetical protein
MVATIGTFLMVDNRFDVTRKLRDFGPGKDMHENRLPHL